MRKFIQLFYEYGMNRRMTEEWLILLCLQAATYEKLLKEIFKQIKEVKIANDVINIVQAIESLINNAIRLLGLEAYARSVGR